MKLDVINEDDYDKAKSVEVVPEAQAPASLVPAEVSDAEITKMLNELDNPIRPQKELAVKIKRFLDARIAEEMGDQGYLSDFVRKWVKDYNEILNNLQKNMHGDKSVNLHKHVVSHSTIAAKIRKYAVIAESPKEEDDGINKN